jgi:hypothetical protein
VCEFVAQTELENVVVFRPPRDKMWALRERMRVAYEALHKGVFIITCVLVVLVALRNSLIW